MTWDSNPRFRIEESRSPQGGVFMTKGLLSKKESCIFRTG